MVGGEGCFEVRQGEDGWRIRLWRSDKGTRHEERQGNATRANATRGAYESVYERHKRSDNGTRDKQRPMLAGATRPHTSAMLGARLGHATSLPPPHTLPSSACACANTYKACSFRSLSYAALGLCWHTTACMLAYESVYAGIRERLCRHTCL